MAGTTGTPPATTTMTLPNGRAIALADWIDDRHWGNAELENADTDEIDLFSNGRGAQIPGGTRQMTWWDTNLPAAGQNGLPKDWEFYVYSLGLEFARATRPTGNDSNPKLTSYSDSISFRTAFELNRRLFCRYKYNGKMYSEGHFSDYPQGQGLSIFTTQPTTELVTNGVPSPRDGLAMVLPIWERSGLAYFWQLIPVIALAIAQPAADGSTALAFVDVRGIKRGLIKRPVN